MSIAYRISAFNRKRKWKLFLNTITFNPKSSILDVGYSENEYSPTDNYLEKMYPYQKMITALGIDTPAEFNRKYPEVQVVRYDGEIFPFENNRFDICWSNAVLEHVGNRARQITFIKEIKRASRIAFITTPNKNFPFEVHTRTFLLHFLPARLFHRYLNLIGKNWATGDYMNLFTLKDLKSLLGEAGITNYRIYKNRLCSFVLDFVVIF